MGWADAFATGFLGAGDDYRQEQERRRRYAWEDDERRMAREQFANQQELTRRAIMREDRAQAEEAARRAMEGALPGQEIGQDVYDIIKQGGYLGRLGKNAPRAALPGDVEGPQMAPYVYQGTQQELQGNRAFDMQQRLQEAQLQNAILGNQTGQLQYGAAQRADAGQQALMQFMAQHPNATPEQILREAARLGTEAPGPVGALYGGQQQEKGWRYQFNPALYGARYGRTGGGSDQNPYQQQAEKDLANLPLTQSALEGEVAGKYAMLKDRPVDAEGNPITPGQTAQDMWPSVFQQRMDLSEAAIPGFVQGEHSLPFLEAVQSLDADLAQNGPEQLIAQATQVLRGNDLMQYIQLVNQKVSEQESQQGGGSFWNWLSSKMGQGGGGRVGR